MNWAALTIAWENCPPSLRKVIVALILLVGTLGGLFIIQLAWRDGLIQQRLGLLVTTTDMQEQTDQLQNYNLYAVDSIVNDAINSYDLLMRQYLANERTMAEDTVLLPLLKTVKQLSITQNVLLRNAQRTDAQIRELPTQFDETLDRILEAYDPQAQQDLNIQLLQEFKALKRQMEEMREEQKTGRRTNKKSF